VLVVVRVCVCVQDLYHLSCSMLCSTFCLE
jgi:hypothetical protein